MTIKTTVGEHGTADPWALIFAALHKFFSLSSLSLLFMFFFICLLVYLVILF